MRLAKYLASAGIASRRASEELIRQARVTVDGAICLDPATDVDSSRDVRFDGEMVQTETQRLVYAVNKPLGVVSTASDPGGRNTVVELIPDSGRLFPVGRLDVNTEGLILLTNDGELANLLMHPRYGVSRTYRARLGGGSLGSTALTSLRGGVDLNDGTTRPTKVRKLAPGLIEIELREGRNRQVRRMCEAVGHPVLALERIAIGPLQLGRLKSGGHRRLNAGEIDELRRSASRR
jgi:23S rRNA pseudouridine2605 synthase